MPLLRIGEKSIPYAVRRSARARRLRITVSAAGVEVVAPRHVREADILAFVERSRSWLGAKTRGMQRALRAHPGAARLDSGAHVTLRGRPIALQVAPAGVTRGRVVPGEVLRVEVPGGLREDERTATVEWALRRWLKREARVDAECLVARHGPGRGLVPRGLRIKEQRHLWGSYTAKGVINLNWRLILAPPAVFEYVVVHELCHLRVPNHQRPFWRLVADVLPDYERQRRWLKDNGVLLSLRPGDPF